MIQYSEEFKEIYRADHIKKNFIIHFPMGDFKEDWDNSMFDTESLNFSEQVCSLDYLKFGLCESAVVTFTTLNAPSLLNVIIQPFIEATGYNGEPARVPLGYFTVKSEVRQNDGIKKKCVAYNCLNAEEMDKDVSEKANDIIEKNGGVASIGEILNGTMESTSSDFSKMDISVLTMTAKTGTLDINSDFEYVRNKKNYEYTISFSVRLNKIYAATNGDTLTLSNKGFISNQESIENSLKEICAAATEDIKDEAFAFRLIYDNEAQIIQSGDTRIGWMYNFETGEVGEQDYITGHDTSGSAYGFIGETPTPLYTHDFYQVNVMKYTPRGGQTQSIRADGDLVNLTTNVATYYMVENILITIKVRSVSGTGKKTEVYSKAYNAFFYGGLDNRYLASSGRVGTISGGNFQAKAYGNYSGESGKDIINSFVFSGKIKGLTKRAILSSYYELYGKFGTVNRITGAIEGRDLHSMTGLYPDMGLYPADDLYPREPMHAVDSYNYIEAQYENYTCGSIGKVVIHHINVEGDMEEFCLDLGNDNSFYYNMTDNFYLLNVKMSKLDVSRLIMQIFAPNISGIEYHPARIIMRGQPYMEAGDTITAKLRNESIETVAMQVRIQGIQNLKGTIIATGLSYTPPEVYEGNQVRLVGGALVELPNTTYDEVFESDNKYYKPEIIN